VRNVVRYTSFLTVLGIHWISRSFPLPPQCMLASLAAMSVVRPSVTRTPSRVQGGRSIKHHTRTQHAVWASPQSRSARGPRGILWKRPAAGRATAIARSADSAVLRPQSKRQLDQTPHAYAACCVGVPAVVQCPPPLYTGCVEYSESDLLSDATPGEIGQNSPDGHLLRDP